MYKFLANMSIKASQDIWRLSIPLKTTNFLWFAKKGVILTKHNLLKRNWNRNKSFVFCSRDENSTLLRVSVCSVHVVDDTSCFGSQMPFECDGYPSHDWHKQRVDQIRHCYWQMVQSFVGHYGYLSGFYTFINVFLNLYKIGLWFSWLKEMKPD